ncbi:bifunctional protein-serine/threonine kinase/phosphatase [Rhizobium halophytocola]|nr:bifunctional protein-serine/threonine kinase/phosphatase [Rhizobium halophytocola]
MPSSLSVTIGQYSDKGRKAGNQDFLGALVPDGSALALKGIALAVADGISTSDVGHVAAETAVKSFLSDYYCTADSWPVKTAAERVISAANAWLAAETRRSAGAYDRDRGYVTTLSALVLKARTAHLFHVGDSRIHRLAGRSLEQLTQDHTVRLSSAQAYLGRALGVESHVEIDHRSLAVARGDIFVMTTDGVHDAVDPATMAATIGRNCGDLDLAARLIAEKALENGSNDNVTVQIVRINALPDPEADDYMGSASGLPLPAIPQPGVQFEGFRICRTLSSSSRSHVFLAEDMETGALAVLKLPSIDMRDDPDYLRRFAMEEWIARRINSAHVARAYAREAPRQCLFVAQEFIEGETLEARMADRGQMALGPVRDIAGQIARGLRAFHRMEMLHQDIRPANLLIDRTGTVKILDFGSVQVAGVDEAVTAARDEPIPGTLQYTAPECLLGHPGSEQSDLFSLGVITYQMLTGHLPYGADAARIRSPRDLTRLRYRPAGPRNPAVPDWVDCALEKAVHPEPARRYQAISEFIHDLSHPNPAFARPRRLALIERNPLRFWQGLCLLLFFTAVALLFASHGRAGEFHPIETTIAKERTIA